jgi:hypothetical protein
MNLSPAQLAAKCINQTNKPVFLTGKGWYGKDYFFDGTSLSILTKMPLLWRQQVLPL